MDVQDLMLLASRVGERHRLVLEEYKKLAGSETSTARKLEYLKAAEKQARLVAELTRRTVAMNGGSPESAKPRAFTPGTEIVPSMGLPSLPADSFDE